MTSWINHFNQTKYSKNRVHRIMQKYKIRSLIRKKRPKYTYSYLKHDDTVKNILQRNFYATEPNQKWATDVTEFKIPGVKKKLYLSAIIDLYDRYPVSYVISDRTNNELVFKTFNKAIKANPQARYNCKTPLEVRKEALASKEPPQYPIAENKMIKKYKEKWSA